MAEVQIDELYEWLTYVIFELLISMLQRAADPAEVAGADGVIGEEEANIDRLQWATGHVQRDGEHTGGDEGDGGKMFREMESIQVEMKEMEVRCSERWRVYRWRWRRWR